MVDCLKNNNDRGAKKSQWMAKSWVQFALHQNTIQYNTMENLHSKT